MSANDTQVGGTHYADGGALQHWDLVEVYAQVGYLEGYATKYVVRHAKLEREKGRESLEKVGHILTKLIELATPQEVQVGQVRTQRGRGVPIHLMHQFARVNNLGPRETAILDAILNWQTVPDLEVARDLVQELIISHYKPARRPKTFAKVRQA